jgi:ABC-type nitrate/sulfonate/bicarbonate transport system substrate-binding protein
MLVNASKLGFDAQAGISIKLVTMAWEDILPSVASAAKTVDVGFGSYVEYLTKYAKLNNGMNDPILFIQPLYVYKGGGFIALSPDIQPLSGSSLTNVTEMQRIKGYRIGAQKQSLYDMMIYSVAHRVGIEPKELHVIDIPMNDGLLALETKSLDLSAAGLTQVTEAQKRGGKLVISMEDAGFADVTGFICKKSILENKRQLLEALIRVWFQCVDYVYSDMEKNSTYSLQYLRQSAATKYTYEEYVQALSQEYLPRTLSDLQLNVLKPGSKYDFHRIGASINAYLTTNRVIAEPTPLPNALLDKPSRITRGDPR